MSATPLSAAAGAAALGGFAPAFWASLSMIIATELGDRTFFLAAIMAMKHDRMAVFLGVMAAMVAMTVISCTFGVAAMVVLPPEYVHYIAAALMLYFSGRMLYEAWKNWNDTGFDEMEEVEQELNKKDDNVDAGACACARVRCASRVLGPSKPTDGRTRVQRRAARARRRRSRARARRR